MNILLVDDHPLFRAGITAVVEELAGTTQCTEVGSCEEALRLLDAGSEFDLILLDLNLPGMDGMAGLGKLREASPATPVIMLSAAENAAKVKQAINAGAKGYIPKSSGREIILGALRLVLAGGVYLPINIIQPSALHNTTHLNAGNEGFTSRQQDVLKLMVRGKSNKEIAYELGMAENTVRTHVAAILKVLNAKNRTEAVYAATNRGMTSDSN